MNTRTAIVDKLSHAFSPVALEVTNESAMHNVPKGSETHFKVVIVSESFEGKSRVDRQRAVYSVLAGELSSGVHALSVSARTPVEWGQGATVAPSPECMGGSKR